MTYPELAARAGIAPRYAREWLEQQAVAGLPAASTDESPERNHRLPAALALPQSAGLGTALRPATVHHLAGEAGFASTRELAIRHDFFRLYVMRD